MHEHQSNALPGTLMSAIPKIHPVTLAFSDANLEKMYRLEQLHGNVGFGWVTNVCAIVMTVAFMVHGRNNSHVRICGTACISGLLSSLPVGRLGNGVLEHKIVERVGVANVVMASYLLSLSGHYTQISTPPQVIAFEFVLFLTVLATHLLAFHFWARASISINVLISFGVFCPPGGFSELLWPTEFAISVFACAFGEALGYTIHLASRKQFLQRKLEAASSRAAILAMSVRNEQLLGEKERAVYELALKPVGASAGPASVGGSTNLSNDELKALLCGVRGGALTSSSGASSAGGDGEHMEEDTLGAGGAVEHAPPRTRSGRSDSHRLQPTRHHGSPVPLYQLRSPYYNEQICETRYLSASEARASLLLRVHGGLLVDAEGMPLAPSRERVAIYVLDSHGAIFLSFEFAAAFLEGNQQGEAKHDRSEQNSEAGMGERVHGVCKQSGGSSGGSSAGSGGGPSDSSHSSNAQAVGHPTAIHHSSMVAGAPVAAAGTMRIRDGQLLSISNESGHYAPPPSSLQSVLARLGAMGVGRLDVVQLDFAETMVQQGAAARCNTNGHNSLTRRPRGSGEWVGATEGT